MTKVQLEYELLKPIDESMMEQIATAHGIYGILRISPTPGLDKLIIEYDASRISPVEVETALHRRGIPVALNV